MNHRRTRGVGLGLSLGLALILFGNNCSHSSRTLAAVDGANISITPIYGPTAGGTLLTITGATFLDNMAVSVGGANCPIVSYSTSQLICTVPAGSVSWAPVVLTTPGQTDITLAQTFAYGANVVGQSSFYNNGVTLGDSLSQPSLALPVNSGVYVADTQSNRVLIYATAPTSSSAAPSNVLGQVAVSGGVIPYTSTTAFETTMATPRAMCTDGTRFMVLDTNRNRLMIYASIPTSPDATPTYVLGQTSFLGELPNQGSTSPSASSLSGPMGLYCDSSTIIVADTGNHRVLIWNTSITTSGQSANVVLGQTSPTAGSANQGSTASATTLSSPRAVAFDGTNLYVADSGNSRVLVWTSLPTASDNDAAATIVLGPSSLTSSSGGGCVQSGLTTPSGLVVANGYLYVADLALNRVQSWSTSGGVSAWSATGQAATAVLGQTSFTSCSSNQATSPATLATLRAPTGLSSSGTNLYVADTGNNRILVFNTAPTASGTAADFQFGQSSTSGVNPAATALSAYVLRAPQFAAIYNGSLYVADAFWNRVLVFSPTPTTVNPEASAVVGQPDFLTAISNLVTGVVSAQTLATPRGLFMDSANNLYVADSANSRVLLFTGGVSTTDPSASTVIGQDAMNTNASATTAVGMNGAAGVCEGDGQLFVADTNNNRVLVFNSWTPASGSGQTATYVIGQSNLTSGTANMGTGVASATSLSAPGWVTCTTTQLIVSDTGNHRVLVYSLPITANTPSASLVLGQPTFITSQANQGLTSATAATLYSPHGTAVDGSNFYIADGHNHRVLVWHTFPTSSGQSADAVFGQSLTTGSYPNGGGSSPTLTSVANPEGLSVYNGLLVISDAGNSRVLMVPEP